MSLACSRRSDSGERCEVKGARKNKSEEGGEVRPLSPAPLYFSSLSLLRTALHYLNAWNRLKCRLRSLGTTMRHSRVAWRSVHCVTTNNARLKISDCLSHSWKNSGSLKCTYIRTIGKIFTWLSPRSNKP